jgi:hypothetical protein
MANVTVCDSCDERLAVNENKFTIRIDNLTLDLCHACYRRVQATLARQPIDAAMPADDLRPGGD